MVFYYIAVDIVLLKTVFKNVITTVMHGLWLILILYFLFCLLSLFLLFTVYTYTVLLARNLIKSPFGDTICKAFHLEVTAVKLCERSLPLKYHPITQS